MKSPVFVLYLIMDILEVKKKIDESFDRMFNLKKELMIGVFDENEMKKLIYKNALFIDEFYDELKDFFKLDISNHRKEIMDSYDFTDMHRGGVMISDKFFEPSKEVYMKYYNYLCENIISINNYVMRHEFLEVYDECLK